MITSKITKGSPKEDPQEKLFKLLESIDWKLWEMYNMMKDNIPQKSDVKKPTTKAKKDTNE
jgi:hypothetical protein